MRSPGSAGTPQPGRSGPASVLVTLAGFARRHVVFFQGAAVVAAVATLFAVGAFTRQPPALAFAAAPTATATATATPNTNAAPTPNANANANTNANANATSTSTSTTTSASQASPAAPVILNTATAEDLRRLPGVGPKRAEAILALRSRLGRFRSIDELMRVKGLGRKTLQRLRPLLRIDPPPE